MDTSSKEKKLSIIESHIKDIKVDKYDAEISLLTQNMQTIKDIKYIELLEFKIYGFSKQIKALEEQYKIIETE